MINFIFMRDCFSISKSCNLPMRLSSNVYLLGTHYFNTYLIKGKICALVEGGLSIQLPILLHQIKDLGISPNEIHYLIILHAHPDHLMTFPILKELYPWMQIVGHTKSQTIVQNEIIMNRFRQSDDEVSRAMVKAGLLEGNSIKASSPIMALDMTIEEGTVINLGNGINLQVIHTPGHSPDSTSLYIEEQRIIFVSDALGVYYPPDYVKPGFFYNLVSYENSVKRIQTMDTEIICKGHQGAIVGASSIREYIALLFSGIKSFEVYVKNALDAGWSQDAIIAHFTYKNQTGMTSLFPFENNLRLTRLMLRRLLERQDHNHCEQ